MPDPGRMFVIFTTQPENDVFQRGVPIQDLTDWRERQTSFSGLLGVTGGTINVSDGAEPRRYQGAFITANAFDVLDVEPVHGRAFAEGEDTPGSPPHVILGYAAWRDHYGLDRGVLERTVRVNGEPAQIIGVMPEGFQFPSNHEIWVPLRDDPQATPRAESRFVQVFGRLADGVSRDRAEAEMASIARQLAEEFPASNEGYGARLEGEDTRRVAVDGVVYEDENAMPSLNRVAVTPGYFAALGSGVTMGRDFTDADFAGAERVAIVNELMVERYFDGQNPIGRQFREGAADTLPRLTVVGVVRRQPQDA